MNCNPSIASQVSTTAFLAAVFASTILAAQEHNSEQLGFRVTPPQTARLAPDGGTSAVVFTQEKDGVEFTYRIEKSPQFASTLEKIVKLTCEFSSAGNKPVAIARRDRKIQGFESSEFATHITVQTREPVTVVQHHQVVIANGNLYYLRTNASGADKRQFFDSFRVIGVPDQPLSKATLRYDGVYRSPHLNDRQVDEEKKQVYDYLVFTNDGMAYVIEGGWMSDEGYSVHDATPQVPGGELHHLVELQDQPKFIMEWVKKEQKERPNRHGTFTLKGNRLVFSYREASAFSGEPPIVNSVDGDVADGEIVAISDSRLGSRGMTRAGKYKFVPVK